MNPSYQNPDFLRLYETYTAAADSLGAKLAAMTGAAMAGDPLIVATSTDIVLYPGAGRAPEVQGYRLFNRGFKELAAVSHLGPAVASLLKMRELDPDGQAWQGEARRMMEATRAVRAANSAALWRDQIAVAAYRGREQAIADMVDYACAMTLRYLERALREPAGFTAQDMREHYLEAKGGAIGATEPMNAVMIATFFLVGLDTGHRIIGWFDRHAIDWDRGMALIVGKQGRPTAGVTWTSNSVCASIRAASRYRLPLERVLIAPHVPSPELPADPAQAAAAARAFESPLRQLWSRTRTVSDLGPLMYDGYPRFAPAAAAHPRLTPGTTEVAELPAIAGPDDWLAMNTRLRVVLEDPRQLLSGCVADYAVDQLQAHGNDPARVVVPGLDGCAYPRT
ncbi:DUF5624 domain-containing protein [Pigmentiphaga sp.]|uniref:DUF5624 domain-containing protein n=1 Tax=Pigmentiphaga sp. TaxID=1977564 RepID=UPI0025F7BEB3|nr:DUF5624 domain-containing protein [Pigmentiphaga sp.]